VTAGRVAILICFLALIAVPLAFRPTPEGTISSGISGEADAQLIIFTPHNEQIRSEFARAFDAWHAAKYGAHVKVIWNAPGGASEIRRMLFAQVEGAIGRGQSPGGNADLMMGGGQYEYEQIKKGVLIPASGDRPARYEPVSAPVEFDDDWLQEMYGANELVPGTASEPRSSKLYDPEKYWFGTALSTFGIIYNRDAMARALGVQRDGLINNPAPFGPANHRPRNWDDLCHPDLQGWVALANPSQSGSVQKMFDTILQQNGWERGWQILRRMAANSRYFAASSLKIPSDVSMGDAAAGTCIDFYGRFESQVIADSGDAGRVVYIDPPDTVVDADPISMLRGAPHPEIAKRFIEFCLSEPGQALWQFRADDPGDDGLGPVRYELRRMPVRRMMYEKHFDRFIDKVNPYELARPLKHPHGDYFSFVPVLFTPLAMENHRALRDAWKAIVEHPAYPKSTGAIVTAADVSDPALKGMLEAFDAMPDVPGLPVSETSAPASAPAGSGAAGAAGMADQLRLVEYSLATDAHLKEIKAAWTRKELWRTDRDGEVDPRLELRLRLSRFFGQKYRDVLEYGKR
jgi:ABC-type Fe3+ transport system substrate-binding protein